METSALPRGIKVDDLDHDAFYTPEQVAPIINIRKTTLRKYCRDSGINTRGPKNSILLTVANIKAIHAWIVKQSTPDTTAPEYDPFA